MKLLDLLGVQYRAIINLKRTLFEPVEYPKFWGRDIEYNENMHFLYYDNAVERYRSLKTTEGVVDLLKEWTGIL